MSPTLRQRPSPWQIRKAPTNHSGRERWWTYPPGEAAPDETWRTWGAALQWVNQNLKQGI